MKDFFAASDGYDFASALQLSEAIRMRIKKIEI